MGMAPKRPSVAALVLSTPYSLVKPGRKSVKGKSKPPFLILIFGTPSPSPLAPAAIKVWNGFNVELNLCGTLYKLFPLLMTLDGINVYAFCLIKNCIPSGDCKNFDILSTSVAALSIGKNLPPLFWALPPPISLIT